MFEPLFQELLATTDLPTFALKLIDQIEQLQEELGEYQGVGDREEDAAVERYIKRETRRLKRHVDRLGTKV